MRVACITEEKTYGYVLSLVDDVTKQPMTVPVLILTGDEAKEARLLKAAIEEFQRLAPVAGITEKLRALCEKRGVAISSKWKIHHFPQVSK